MGAQIAAHLANAGVPVLLLDVTRDAAADGLERARALKPDPFFTPTVHTLIRTGGFDEDLAGAADLGLDHRSGRRAAGREARAVRAHRPPSHAADDRQLQHLGDPDCGDRRGPVRVLQGAHARHTLLQPPSVSATARSHSNAGHRSRGRRRDCAVRRPSPRQRRRPREGHAELHRESSRHLRRAADPPGLGTRRPDDRRDRRDHGSGDRAAEERHVSDDGSRGHRRARTLSSATWPSVCRATKSAAPSRCRRS